MRRSILASQMGTPLAHWKSSSPRRMRPPPHPQPGCDGASAHGGGGHRAGTGSPRWASVATTSARDAAGPTPGWGDTAPPKAPANRLTVLVSSAERPGHGVTEQLPRLLEPVGIRCLPARSGEEAQQVLQARRVHIAVIDLAIPLRAPRPGPALSNPWPNPSPNPSSSPLGQPRHAGQPGQLSEGSTAGHGAGQAATSSAQAEAGARLLQLLRRLDSPPPTIVIRPPQPSLRESARGLSDALREGAFAVLDRPLQLEAVLEALRRIIARHYAHVWAGPARHSGEPPEAGSTSPEARQ
jgi:DNA-binding NarL/FixJ family response regulator